MIRVFYILFVLVFLICGQLFAAVPASNTASASCKKTLTVEFGISLPVKAPVIVVDNPDSVEMKQLNFIVIKKLNVEESQTQANIMCKTYFEWVELGRRTYPRSFSNAIQLVVNSKCPNQNDEVLQEHKINRNVDPYEKLISPFTSYDDCVSRIRQPLEELSKLL